MQSLFNSQELLLKTFALEQMFNSSELNNAFAIALCFLAHRSVCLIINIAHISTVQALVEQPLCKSPGSPLHSFISLQNRSLAVVT